MIVAFGVASRQLTARLDAVEATLRANGSKTDVTLRECECDSLGKLTLSRDHYGFAKKTEKK